MKSEWHYIAEGRGIAMKSMSSEIERLERELQEAKELLGYASKRLYQLAKTNNDYILVERINKRLESEAGDE